jgi:hypothetical protein
MERNDSKSTTTTGFPVDGQIARVDLVSHGQIAYVREIRGLVQRRAERTLTRLVSKALVETRRLS